MNIVKIDILNHADYGGEFKEHSTAPGLSKFYSAIESIRSNNRENTLLLDAGDNINRILWHGKEVFEGLALIGTDAYTLGNHEFDKGPKELEECVEYINDKFPVLCANVVYKDTNELIKGTKPYIILERNNIKYGIVGCTTEYTDKMVDSESFKNLQTTSSVEAIRKYIPIMREEGAEIIIVLTHFPFYFTEDSQSGELIDVYEAIKDLKPDVMIGGHIPGDYARVLGTCAITKGGFSGKSLPHIELYFDLDQRVVVDRKCEVIDVWHGDYKNDENIDQFVERITSPYDYYLNEVLGVALEDIPMRLSKESPMGNLIADAVKEYFNCDFVYFNTTSCGWNIPKGNITRLTISKAMGFNDNLYKTVYKGKDIKDLFINVLEPERFGNNGNIMFAGFIVSVDNRNKHPNKLLSIKTIDGNDIDLDKEYSVITSKYMASGGNDTSSITNRVTFEDTGVPIHNILIDYVKNQKELKRPKIGRYLMVGEIENDNSPW